MKMIYKENRSPNVNVTVLPQSVHCSAESVCACSKNVNSQQAISRGLGVVGDCSQQHPNSMLECIRDSLKIAILPAQWYNFATDMYRSVQVSKVELRAPQQPYVSCTITVHLDLSWEVIVEGKVVPSSYPVQWEQSPYVYSVDCLLQQVKLVDGATVCQGNSDPDFTDLCKHRGGQITSNPGHVSAYIDSEPLQTARHTDCEMLCNGNQRC